MHLGKFVVRCKFEEIRRPSWQRLLMSVATQPPTNVPVMAMHAMVAVTGSEGEAAASAFESTCSEDCGRKADMADTSSELVRKLEALTKSGHLAVASHIVLGLKDLLTDPSLQTRPDQIAARSWTLPIVAEAVAKRDYADLLADCEAAALLCSPIARPAEMYDDPHVTRPGGLIHSAYADKKDFRAPGLPFSVDGIMPVPVDTNLPSVGQHTFEVLSALPQRERA